METISSNDIRNMSFEQFFEYLVYINKKLRNLEDNEVVLEENMEAGDLVSPTNVVKENILKYLCSSMQDCHDDINCAAMVYYTLINLHMFSDGNGRTSRYLFDVLVGNSLGENIGYYYHKDSGVTDDIKDNFEKMRGLLDPSIVNRIPDEIMRERLSFIPLEILEKYSWITVGRTNNSQEITEILPSHVLEKMSHQEINDLNKILCDGYGCNLTPAGLAMVYVCLKKGELDKWTMLEINNQPIELRKSFGIEGRLCFPVFKHPELIADWTIEDFRTIIKVGNEIKYERLKSIIDIFVNSNLFIDKESGISYRDEIILTDEKLNSSQRKC